MSILQMNRRRTVRAPVNPMDKATVVSIYPKSIHEIKHTIQPGIFDVAPGRYETPSILVVGPSSWWRDIDEEQPLLEIPNSSIQIADSIVNDYCNGVLAFSPEEMGPGLFYIPGVITIDSLKKNHKDKLDEADRKQKKWYAALVEMGDVLWSRSNRNPIAISDDMRLAAQELNMKNKDWMQNFTTLEMVNCVFCGALRNPNYPICGACHQVVDKKLHDQLVGSTK